MANNDFFSEDQMDDQNQEQELIAIGDKQYSQDQLSKLVGLGEIAEELESKWNTKIDRIYPEYTKTSQRNSELERRLQDQEQQQIQSKINQGQQLSNEEIKRQALQQASELGLSTRDEVQKIVADSLAGFQLLNDVQGFITKQASEGLPNTTPIELLSYMDENGIKNPDKAYKLMFEDQLEKIKEQKLSSIRPQGLYTESSSQAGGKQPEPVRATKDNLDDLVLTALRGGR